jgi:hypothetical protein
MDTADIPRWTLYVQIASVVTTFLAVLLALFGERLRAAWFRPRLVLRLLSALGESTPAEIKEQAVVNGRLQEIVVQTLSRYYHVEVSNRSRWPKATNVQIFVLRIEEPGPDGTPIRRWTGVVPLTWQWSVLHELRRTIGSPAIADLGCVVRGRGFSLSTQLVPSSAGGAMVRPPDAKFRMTVVLQARGDEGESDLLPIEIAWDGQWADGDAEMAQHLIVKEIVPRA